MSRTLQYRQQVGGFRERLNRIVNRRSGRRRVFIDTTGNRTRTVPHASSEELLVLYGQARHHSVARILSVFEIAREVEHLDRRSRRLRAEPRGAFWQAYKGNTSHNACHTCPSLLNVDGQLPTLLTSNRGLRRHMIIEFADCMLVPRSINNDIDRIVDDQVGATAFARAAELVLNEPGADWHAGLVLFRQQMRSLFDYLVDARSNTLAFDSLSERNQEILDTLAAYYEGLYLHTPNDTLMQNFAATVRAEAARPL
jgi:hypothetical protein